MAKSSTSRSKRNSNSKDEGGMRDCCGICGRLLLLLFAVIAVVLSLLVVASCEFIEFYAVPPNTTEPTEFSFGQFRYQVNETGCVPIDDSGLPTDWTITTGRVSTAVSLICAGVACLAIIVEFVCCRFKFSRCLLITLFSIAVLGVSMAFLSYASSICTSENQAGRRYPCKAGQGTWYAVAAIGLYFLTSIASCFAPRPKPMIRRLKDDENDPCLCCGEKKKEDGKKEDKEKTSKPVDEEQPEPTPLEEPPAPPPPPPPITQETQTSTNDAAIVAAAAVPVATQTVPVSQIEVHDGANDDMSQASSTVHPSNVSAVTMPVYRDVSIYDGDMFFDAGADAKSV